MLLLTGNMIIIVSTGVSLMESIILWQDEFPRASTHVTLNRLTTLWWMRLRLALVALGKVIEPNFGLCFVVFA